MLLQTWTGAQRIALALVLGLAGAAGLVALTMEGSGAAASCTVRWVNAAGGSWSDAASWSGGAVPGALDDVCIDAPGGYEVALTGSVSIRSLTIGGGPGGPSRSGSSAPREPARS